VSRAARLGMGIVLVAGLGISATGTASAVAWGTWVDTPATSVPWVLPLYSTAGPYGPGKAICTSTAIAPRVVVTAAACVAAPGFYSVGVGGNLLSRGTYHAVEAVLPDPHYSATTHLHDIAVLRTLRPLNLSTYARIAPARVTRRLAGDPGVLMTLLGWGRNEDSSSTKRLREGLVLRQDAAASATFPRFRSGPMLAAGRPRPRIHGYTRACGIDAGGPLVVRSGGTPYLVGVTSWGAARCTAHRPTVFTAVASHRTWLHDAVANLPAQASSHNRAVPESLIEPTIGGAVAVGSTLTCAPGTWTANARQIGYRWDAFVTTSTGAEAESDSVGTTYTLTGHEIGQVSCLVDATSSAGTSTAVAGVRIPSTPQGAGLPSIVGLPTLDTPASLPAPGTVYTCKPPRYGDPAVQVAYSWSMSTSSAPPETIGSGPSLTLTTDLLTRLAGNRLACDTTASIGGFYPDSRSTGYYQMPDLRPPFVSLVTISPSLDPNTPPPAGTQVSCAADVTGGPPITVTYTWALQDTDPYGAGVATLDADARILGHDPTYTMIQQDVDDFATQYLVCRVEGSSWQGTDAWWDWY
jgi:secreted trypsin-like serine protease